MTAVACYYQVRPWPAEIEDVDELQHGVPPEVYVSKLTHMRFEASGLTNDADIRVAKSIVDYLFRSSPWGTWP